MEVFKYKVDDSTQKMDVNANCKEHIKLLQRKHKKNDVNKKVIFNAKNDVKSAVLSADRSDNVKSGQDDHDWKYRNAMWRLNYKRTAFSTRFSSFSLIHKELQFQTLSGTRPQHSCQRLSTCWTFRINSHQRYC